MATGPGYYETAFKSPVFGPGWMHDPVGDAYWSSIGKVFDEQMSRAKAAVKIHGPQGALALGASDALDALGDDRLLPRAGTTPAAGDESDADYAARLNLAWDIWAWAGTPFGLLTALGAAGFPTGATGATLVNHIGKVYQLDANGDLVITSAGVCINRQRIDGAVPGDLVGFTLDARDQFYSRFKILFLEDVTTLLNDSGNPVKACLNQTVQRWRCGGAIYDGAVVIPQENSAKCLGWPLDVEFGDGGLVFGTNGARIIDKE